MNRKPFKPESIAIIGSGGQLGHALMEAFGQAASGFKRTECDLTVPGSAEDALLSNPFEWVINTAAYTNVDGAESDPLTCDATNHIGVERLAIICQRTKSKLIHISTDYIFGGNLERRFPYLESDTPAPQGIYAKSKLDGERAAAVCEHHLILRTCGLYDAPGLSSRSKNFCNTILAVAKTRDELTVVDDQWCTPTYIPHFVEAIMELMRCNAEGIFNVVNEGNTTWCRFARRLLELAEIPTRVRAIDSSQYPAAVTRPTYSVLDTTKYRSTTGSSLPSWEVALAEYVTKRRRFDMASEV